MLAIKFNNAAHYSVCAMHDIYFTRGSKLSWEGWGHDRLIFLPLLCRWVLVKIENKYDDYMQNLLKYIFNIRYNYFLVAASDINPASTGAKTEKAKDKKPDPACRFKY